MRHLWSLVLSLVLTPLIYVSAGLSAVKFGEARGLGITAGVGLLAAFVAGALYAVLVMVRLSPVGPIVAGLIYLGVTFWSVLDRSGFEGVMPADIAGEEGLLHVPVGMGTALLAAPLLLTVFSSRRWRGAQQPAPVSHDAAPVVYPEVDASAVPTNAPTPVSAAPSYTTPSSVAPTYEPPVYTPPNSASTAFSLPNRSSGDPAARDGDRTDQSGGSDRVAP
jgi:hypothetical protein